MTKKKIYEATSEAVAALKLGDAVMAKLTPILEDNLAPKLGGGSVNLAEVTKTNEAGKVTEVLCQVSKVWLPASTIFFYEDKSENPRIVGTEGKGIKRLSKQAESISKKFGKTNKASVQAITDDILALDMAQPENIKKSAELKAKLEKVKAQKPDYSTVSAKPAAK